MKKHGSSVAVMLLAVVALALPAQAGQTIFTNGVSDDWADANNWLDTVFREP